MNFKIADVSKSGREIARKLIKSTGSQLLIPPKLQEKELQIDNPVSEQKYVGLFSSGTTGMPKCVWNEFNHLVKNAHFTAEAFGVRSDHRLLMMAAPWHVAGLSWMIMAEELGCDYKFITTKKGEEQRWFKAVQEFEPDFLLTVPAVLRALNGKDWYVPTVVFGGYSLEKGELQKLKAHSDFTIQGYGQTEAGGLIAAHKRKSVESIGAYDYICCGSPIKGVTIRCDGTPENPALIFIQSQTAFTDVEYDSRDLGFIDQSGNIYVIGRADKIVQKK